LQCESGLKERKAIAYIEIVSEKVFTPTNGDSLLKINVTGWIVLGLYPISQVSPFVVVNRNQWTNTRVLYTSIVLMMLS
jgi:hypothetical protein